METTSDLDRGSAALVVERLTKVYGDGTKALDGLELRVRRAPSSGCARACGSHLRVRPRRRAQPRGATARRRRASRGPPRPLPDRTRAARLPRTLLRVAEARSAAARRRTARNLRPDREGEHEAEPPVRRHAPTVTDRARARPPPAARDPRRADRRCRSGAAPRALALPAPPARRARRDRALDDPLHRGGRRALRAVAFIHSGRIISEGAPAELVDRYGGKRLEDAYVKAMRR
jgi:hypothetical protein